MKRFLSLCLVAICALMLSACGHRAARKFLGKWVNISRPTDTLLISRDGDQYIIADQTHQLAAKFCDGRLIPNNDKGWCAYLKDSDTINCAGTSYRREK